MHFRIGLFHFLLIPVLPSMPRVMQIRSRLLPALQSFTTVGPFKEMDYEVFCKSTFTDTHTIALSPEYNKSLTAKDSKRYFEI